ncbi:ABC transporter substrate-binding protein [uncultured Methylobacterium sp.]|jgi:branched-chain amino acid transport system substrate-binding protein|uniref:ABC transporter substrate-binding protein n=1 Tax=uncultured Methylobacterium sp. TaxID=157278 RepID=UPI00261052E9|nr:ABC transporter substrate-binding protein [uncultured Methylobacterium sp.]
MSFRVRVAGAAGLALSLLMGTSALAQGVNGPIKVGVLSDMSGPFADQAGTGSVVAAQLAADDFSKEAGELKVEIVSADHQNKPDIGLATARRWLDQEGVATIVDLPNSAVALAVANLMKERHRVALASSSLTSDLTGKACAPTTVQWVSDTWAQGSATARAVAGRGLKSWYFLTVDYALGQALERDATVALKAAGGTVKGSTKHPLNAGDFASPLLAAQGSGAQVLALADTGADMINAVKQAAEFGLMPEMRIAALFVQLSDIHALGLKAAQGLQLASSFYWDRTEGTRAFGKRFAERMNGRMPTENHAGVYSSTLAFLRAARDAGTIEGEKVVAAMREKPINDALFGTVTIRQDGRAVHDVFLYEVKTPDESKGPYDYYKPLATVPGDQAFRPLADGGCPLVK